MEGLAFKADLAGKQASTQLDQLKVRAAQDALDDHAKMQQLAMDAAKPKNPGDPPPNALEVSHKYSQSLMGQGFVEAGLDALKKTTDIEKDSAETQLKVYEKQSKVFSEMANETADIQTEDQWRGYLARRQQLHPEVLTDPKLAPAFMRLQEMEWSPDLMKEIHNGATTALQKVQMQQSEAAAARSRADTKRIEYETNVAIPTRLRQAEERTTAYVKTQGAKVAGVGKPPSAGLVNRIRSRSSLACSYLPTSCSCSSCAEATSISALAASNWASSSSRCGAALLV
jgi:hypothetical protein